MGDRWPCCSLGQLLVGLVGALLQGIVMSIPASLAEGEHAAGALGMALGGTIATAFTAPCSAAIVTLLYMDLRARKEHYTLGMLADAVGEAGGARSAAAGAVAAGAAARSRRPPEPAPRARPAGLAPAVGRPLSG